MNGIYLFLLVYVEDCIYRDISLHKIDNPYTSLWSSSGTLTTYYPTNSIKECAMRCLEQNNTCSAIAFDPDNNTCVTGICVISQPVTRSPSLSMYQVQPPPCNSTQGFNVETNGHSSACLWWSTTQNTFIDAKADCKAKGAILATFKTYEKFELLRVKTGRIYIGLDDLEVEGTYRWHDDNSKIDMGYSKNMFSPGDPNDVNHQENCISLYEQYQKLMDYICSARQLYVCEKICFTF